MLWINILSAPVEWRSAKICASYHQFLYLISTEGCLVVGKKFKIKYMPTSYPRCFERQHETWKSQRKYLLLIKSFELGYRCILRLFEMNGKYKPWPVLLFHYLWMCEGRKELAHTTVRLQLILSPEITGAFLFRTLVDFSTYLLHRFTASLAP